MTSTGFMHRLIPDLGLSEQRPMDARTLHSLAVLLLLVQLPHLMHLPLWVSLTGGMLVSARLFLLRAPAQRALKILLSPIAVTALAALSAFLIKADYGYFVGRDPAVAFLFILVAAKFAEVRRASDATLLLCLAAFLLLTQYFYSQAIIATVVTVPAVVALAYTLSILRDPHNPSRNSEQLRLVGSLLLQGIPLAALLFVVFPRLPGPLWSLPEDAMATTGLSDSMSPGSIGQLSQSDAVAFRVEFDGAIPPRNQRYWRGPVLTEFDGRRWTTSPASHTTQPVYQGDANDLTHYTVTLQPHRQRWLFALESAASLPRSYDAAETTRNPDIALSRSPSRVLGKLMNDGQMIATDTVSQVLRYRQSSVPGSAIRVSRPPHDKTLFLPGRNQRTLQFARKIRASVDSDSEFTQRILQHFNRESFFYTLNPQLLGHTPVDEFLFNTRAGFCEHYASAFVVMMRAVGIPSRVVTGYQGGEMNNDYMIVRQSDAHAWAESFIDGVWKRFDPTAAVAPSRVEHGLASALPNDSAVPGLARSQANWLRSAQLRWDALNHRWQTLVVDFDNDSQDKLWDKLGLGTPALWQITAIVIAIASIWCAAILGIPVWSRSKLSHDERLWQRLIHLLETHDLSRGLSETPTEYLQRAAQRWPAQAIAFSNLGRNFDRLRFQASTADDTEQLRIAVKQSITSLSWTLKRRAIALRFKPRRSAVALTNGRHDYPTARDV